MMPGLQQRPGDPILDAIAAELSHRDPSLAHALLDALLDLDRDDDLAPGIWGPRPSTEATLTATARSHQILGQARDRVLATSLTRSEAAGRLRVGPQRVSTLVEDGELIALEDAGKLRIPDWQFHPDTPKGRLDGIREVAAAAATGPVSLTQWVSRPNPALAGRTPVRALIDGDVTATVNAARTGA